MAFLRRAERILEEREPVRLDHQLLIASLATQKNATARARATGFNVHVGPREEDPMIEVLVAGPRWREASLRQRGCFNRAESGRLSNGA